MNYIVVDTDSCTGIFRDAFFGWVYTSGISFDVAFLSGKATSAKTTEAFAADLLSLCPKVEIVRYMASSLKDHADILCGVAIGRIVERHAMQTIAQDTSVFIISCDHLVTSLAQIASKQGLKTFVVSVDNGTMTVRHNKEIVASVQVDSPKTHPLCDRILPEWATRKLNKEEKLIGLFCEKVPTEEFFEKPAFVPFPKDCAEVSIGSRAGDIDLLAWDGVKTGLYPKCVTIKYFKIVDTGNRCVPMPEFQWTIRSNKGFRKSAAKAIYIDERLIDASSGDVPLKNGAKIRIGGFSFIFIADKMESFLRFESDVEIAKQIELLLKECASRIPWPLIEREHIWVYNAKTGEKLDLEQNFQNATYSTYFEIIIRFWNWFPLIEKRFCSFERFENTFNFGVKRGRNLSDHASSGGPSVSLKRKMISFLFVLEEELKNWDVNHKCFESQKPGLRGLMQAFDQAFGEQS